MPEPEPTTIIALWPDDVAPTLTEVVAALNGVLDAPVEMLDEPGSEDAEVQWCAAIDTHVLDAPIIVWAEPAHPLEPGELDDPAAESARWVVGVQTELPADDPLTGFAAVIRLLASALSASPALLDVNTTRWLRRREIETHFLAAQVEPPAEVLWIIHVVEATTADGSAVWLHTHGLARCGRAELEMIGVERQMVPAAAHLLNAIAELALDYEMPGPGEPLEVGAGLTVVLEAWPDVASRLPADQPGSLEDRDEDDGAHTGVRAVICAERDEAEEPTCPRAAIERIIANEAAVYMTARATQRQAAIAQSTWGELATAFSASTKSAPDGDTGGFAFLVKAGFDAGVSADDGREHLWFEARRFDGNRVEGELMNQPVSVSHMQRGDVVWIDRTNVSDWRLSTPASSFGPDDISDMWTALDERKPQTEPGP